MSFKAELDASPATITLSGRLEAEQVASLRKLFWSCYAERQLDQVIVRLSDSAVLDAVALSLLVGARNLASKAGARLHLVCGPGPNYDLLRQLDLHQYFEVSSS